MFQDMPTSRTDDIPSLNRWHAWECWHQCTGFDYCSDSFKPHWVQFACRKLCANYIKVIRGQLFTLAAACKAFTTKSTILSAIKN